MKVYIIFQWWKDGEYGEDGNPDMIGIYFSKTKAEEKMKDMYFDWREERIEDGYTLYEKEDWEKEYKTYVREEEVII